MTLLFFNRLRFGGFLGIFGIYFWGIFFGNPEFEPSPRQPKGLCTPHHDTNTCEQANSHEQNHTNTHEQANKYERIAETPLILA